MTRMIGRRIYGNTALIVVTGLVLTCPAFAHKLSLFATISDGQIHGKVYFPTGGAPDLKVEVVDANGNALGETVSDAEGRFTLSVPSTLPVTLVSETIDGHRAEFVVESPTVEYEGDHATPVESISEERIRTIVQDEIAPMREQIAEQASRSRARDIFGGIGYIAGVFGLIVLLKRSAGKAK